ncbi:MAG: hypothetical protein ACRDF4_04050 [Rhabdochlamydiaceae bacterium]
MKWPQHLFSAVQFFQVLLLVIGGVFCLALPLAPALRITIANSFLFKDALFFCLGIILVVVGLILGLGFYFLQRHQLLQVSMNPPVSIENEVIAKLVQTYLQQRFPNRPMKTEAVIDHRGLIELTTELPQGEIEKHLQEMEVEIGQLLKQTLGYQKKFTMTFTCD